jgi:hypothetical protein
VQKNGEVARIQARQGVKPDAADEREPATKLK